MDYLYPAWFILCVTAGAVVGYLTEYGTFKGMTDGALVAASPLLLVMIGLALMSIWRPILPKCRCGECPRKNKRYVSPANDGQKIGIRVQCPVCGRIYATALGRFDEVADNGQIIPYMHHSKWGRWKRHADQPPAQP